MRILVADDDQSVIRAYRLCLEKTAGGEARAVDQMADELFGAAPAKAAGHEGWGQVDFVTQGEDAVRVVTEAREAGDPIGVLFLDMLMPPGIDGRETARRVRKIDPQVNIVIVTGYSDHSPADICEVAGPEDKVFFLAKPFEPLEIRTLANSLGAKWKLERDLNAAQAALSVKIADLEAANRELAASEARCRHIAMHDQLTQLPNRTAFQAFLDGKLADPSADIAVMFVDLDRFKHINDTLGHAAGDDLIRGIGGRLQGVIPADAMIARLGGDEFGIVLLGAHAVNAEYIGASLVRECTRNFDVLGAQVRVGASIGVAIRETPQQRSHELLRRADLALYAAKNKGRNRVEMFVAAFDESARKRAEVEARLRIAMAQNTLTLAYQPIHDPGMEAPVGFEALLRWTDEHLGTISPSIFVPIAEETGLIIELGEWVIRNAIAECARWPEGFVSINLSTRHFQSPELVTRLVDVAAHHGVEHERIQLEITETALFDDGELAASILSTLRDRGFRIALDDFGTGYSSLVNLKDFEIDCIKIDRSFVAKLGIDPASSAIVQAVAGLARALGLKVVAEGVESESQVQALRLSGCELMQGFYFGQAVDSKHLFNEDGRERKFG